MKYISEADILNVMSTLTREEDASFIDDDLGVRLYCAERLLEVLSDVSFDFVTSIEDGSGSQNSQQEPEPQSGQLGIREASVEAGHNDGDVVRRQARPGLGVALERSVAIAVWRQKQATLARAKRVRSRARTRYSRGRR